MKPRIISTKCKRCGKNIATLNRSLYGANAAKAQYGSMCKDCLLPHEKIEIEKAVENAVYRKVISPN